MYVSSPYSMGMIVLLVISLIMLGSASVEDEKFDEEIYSGLPVRGLRGKKGIYSNIGLIVGTIGCFCSALYCCIRIARKEAVLRNGMRFHSIKLTEEQRRAILEFLFPGKRRINSLDGEKACSVHKTFNESPQTPTTIVENVESDNSNLIDSFANILQPNNTRETLFPLPRLSNLQELHIDHGVDPKERFIYEHQEDEKLEANIPCCSICLENYVEDDEIICSKRCRHYFHKECIMPWLLKETSRFRCPSCRQHMINTNDLREATSKIVGEHAIIVDEIIEELEAQANNTPRNSA